MENASAHHKHYVKCEMDDSVRVKCDQQDMVRMKGESEDGTAIEIASDSQAIKTETELCDVSPGTEEGRGGLAGDWCEDESNVFCEKNGGPPKRIARPDLHKKNIRKEKLERGEPHIGSRGKLVPGKVFSDTPCGCSMKCNDKIGEEQRREIFSHFYSLNWEMKSAFICEMIIVTAKRRKYTRNEVSRRNMTQTYRLPKRDGGEEVVCKKYFRETLLVSDGKIHNTVVRKNNGLIKDNRGRHPPSNKTKESDVEFVCQFIENFSSNDPEEVNCPKRKYSCPNQNVTQMYLAYEEACGESNRTPVSLFVFRKTLKEKS